MKVSCKAVKLTFFLKADIKLGLETLGLTTELDWYLLKLKTLQLVYNMTHQTNYHALKYVDITFDKESVYDEVYLIEYNMCICHFIEQMYNKLLPLMMKQVANINAIYYLTYLTTTVPDFISWPFLRRALSASSWVLTQTLTVPEGFLSSFSTIKILLMTTSDSKDLK